MIIYSLIACLATASFAKALHFSMQQGQWLEKWQGVLYWLETNGYENVAKPLGRCDMCFGYWIATLSWIGFFAVSGYHMSGGMWVAHWFCYVHIGAMLNLFFITRLFK